MVQIRIYLLTQKQQIHVIVYSYSAFCAISRIDKPIKRAFFFSLEANRLIYSNILKVMCKIFGGQKGAFQ